MNFLQNWFKKTASTLTRSDEQLSASDFMEKNGKLINEVVQDIVEPFLNRDKPDSQTENDLSYTLKLLDADTCGQMAFFLSKNMGEMIKSYDISGFGSPINIVAPGAKSITEANIKTVNGMVSKKQICDRLAGHYVNILNLIAAILTGINPDTNMAMSRMQSLYTLVDGSIDTFLINVCTSEGRDVVKSQLLDEPGVRELMGLYMFHLLSVSETPADKDRVIREYQNLVKRLVDDDRTVRIDISNLPQPTTSNTTKNTSTVTPETTEAAETTVKTESAAVEEKPGFLSKLTSMISENQPSDTATTQPAATTSITEGNPEAPQEQAPTTTTNENPEEIPEVVTKPKRKRTINRRFVKGKKATNKKNRKAISVSGRRLQNQISKLENKLSNIKAEGSSAKELEKKIKKLISDLKSPQKNKQHGGNDNLNAANSTQTTTAANAVNLTAATNTATNSTQTTTAANAQEKEDVEEVKPSKNKNTTTMKPSLSVNASVERFINFVDKYLDEKPNEKNLIMRTVLTLFKGSHFARMSKNKLKQMCENAKSEGKPIQLAIDKNNKTLVEYQQNYLKMKNDYMNSVRLLTDILENKILQKNKDTQKYEIRDLSGKQLEELETQVRMELGILYSTSHEHYLRGLAILNEYYTNIAQQITVS